MKFRKIAEYLTRQKREGNFVILDGDPGSGKTNFAGLLMESLIIDFDFEIITNIRFEEKALLKYPDNERDMYGKIHSKIHFACKYSDWLLATTKIKGHNVTVIDDAQSSIVSSKTQMSKHGQNNSDFARYIRKRKSNLIYVSHDPKYIPYSIYNKKHLYLFKRNIYEIQYLGETYYGVPRTGLMIDTYDTSTWEYDIDVDYVMKQLNEVPKSKRNQTIINIIRGKVDDGLDARAVLEWLWDRGYPDKAYYELFPSYYKWKPKYDKKRSSFSE